MKKARAHVVVRGIVQGVFFRASTRDEARGLNLSGWTRNNPDGSVEAVFEGREEDVKAAVEWCRRGPLGARVDKIEVEWQEFAGEFQGFEVAF